MSRPARPKFDPTQAHNCENLLTDTESTWTPIISCSANFPVELFEIAVSQLIHHPEYNSTLILRSEIISDTNFDFPKASPNFSGFKLRQSIHRKLLPRRPGRDAALEQYCSLYGSTSQDVSPTDTLVLTPIISSEESLPYYHPAVSHLAFRYIISNPPCLRIEVKPLPNTPTDPNSRLYRTCLALLETLHRYGWGALTNYKKRVNHDCLVPREPYQDLYLLMRNRHKHLVDTWQEVTDPLKHVFEDIGIATYLMLLWKDSYSHQEYTPSVDPGAPWKSWPRPPGGFLDLGCGNGLLTHILIEEGYEGYGFDVRARMSWTHYPEPTQARLHVYPFNPMAPLAPGGADAYFKPGIFLIGNHADELTPWVPVLSTLHSASGYLSIPCCAWSFDTKYERTTTPMFPIPGPDFADSLNLGGEGSNASSYSMYRIWLASLALYCGWAVECETLRIPSTRNWAIIGRQRLTTDQGDDYLVNAERIRDGVLERGVFKTRKPEGKASEH